MRQLTSHDALFLASESRRTPCNISSLAILSSERADGSRFTIDDIRDLFAERIHLLAPLRWRLATTPLGLTHPWWVDTDVDLDFHVREIALPPPADERSFTDKVAWLAAQPMDRSRPLWEAYLIHGVPDGNVALLTKFHHAAMDGISGAEVMSVLLDGAPTGREIPTPPPHRPEPMPSELELFGRGILSLPGQQISQLTAASRALPHVDQIPQARSLPGVRTIGRIIRAVTPDDSDDEVDSPPVPRLRFNAEVSAKRRLELVTLPLSEIKAMKNRFGTTVNDAVVAICSGALRRWLDAAGELPDQPMVALVPVSIRRPDEAGTFGNAVAAMVAELPTDDPDPLRRLERCRDEMRHAKDRFGATPASLLSDANDMLPPALFGTAMRAILRISTTDLAEPPGNLVISNVPGSRSPLYCCGAEVLAHYPVSVLADTLGLNITVFSYRDRLDFCLIADPELVPELADLATAIVDEFDGLAALPDAAAEPPLTSTVGRSRKVSAR